MPSPIRRFIFVLLSCLILPAAALHAGEEEELIEVTATGAGKDSDEARKNALRDAVEQTVGSMVDSKIMIENDALISDLILGHSGGFVKRHEIIEGPTTKDGLVEVTIRAWVQRARLAAKLEAEKVVVRKVDGLSLGGEAMTRSMSKTSSREMLQGLIKDFPGGCVSLEVAGDPDVDDSGEKVMVKIRVSIDRDAIEGFIERFGTYLEQAAAKKHKNERTSIEDFQLGGKPALRMKNYMMKYADYDAEEYRVALLARLNEDSTIAQWKVYGVTQEIADMLDAHLKAVPDLVVEVIGSDGEAIDSKRCKVEYPFRQTTISKARSFFFLPFFAFPGMDAIVMPGPMEYDVLFDNLFPDEISDIREIKLSLQR